MKDRDGGGGVNVFSCFNESFLLCVCVCYVVLSMSRSVNSSASLLTQHFIENQVKKKFRSSVLSRS